MVDLAITSARSTNIAAEILIVSLVLRGTRVAPCCRWDTRQRGAAPWRGRDEQPSWTREQPVLLAEVVAPPLLSRGAAISGSGGALVVVEVVVVVVVVGVVVVVAVVVVEGVFVFLVHH